ncbi:MAG: cysteine--tRNA ligase [Peptostreptococcaceae bacterium]|nr:cysteine--tRNA ligase [Peptostreptococcaceae bacterium]
MRLYNTLTRQKEEFVPIQEGKVKMYSCGPTVYNYFHIGNARPFIMFDLLRNYLIYKGYDVTFVQNFTDVDDKIINRANEEGVSPFEIAERYINEYFVDADALGIRRADVHPRVTENIPEIIDFIQNLITSGYAYESEGDVFFDTQKFKDYGKLSRQNLAELNLGARIDVNSSKRHPMDFVLWKKKKANEIGWESPWGEGRPGWHIECSVMSRRYLGDTIDIHSGGQDLIFPHHENEIAQSEARTGKPFANFWVHNGFINIDNEKMSKSLGNFFTVREISEQMDLEIVRFFMLNAHYRGPVNYSKDLLDQAKAGMERLYNARDMLEFVMSKRSEELDESKEQALIAQEHERYSNLQRLQHEFDEAMDDDLNTANAITVIFELASLINEDIKQEVSLHYLDQAHALFTKLTSVLNIIQKRSDIDEQKIEELIAKRAEAKKNKDFQTADAIRDELKAMGVELLDTREGTTYKVISQ